jgi:hypothetical protein
VAGQHRISRVLATALVVLTLLAAAGAAAAQHDHHGTDAASTPTAAEQAAADELVAATRAGVARFADVRDAEAAGYRVVTPFAFYGARAAHFQNPAYATDGRLLDPERPEDLMYLKHDDGSLTLVGVMFVAPIGKGPRVGGPLTNWHVHDDLCASLSGLAPTLPTGACPDGTRSLNIEMLHVWLIDHPDGPFADGPPPSIVTVPLGATASGGSLAAGTSLIDGPAMAKAIAGVLGLNPLAVGQRLQAGESLTELAADQNVSRQALADAVQQRIEDDWDRAVAAEDMTAAQRDLLVSMLPMMVDRMLDLHPGEPWIIGSESTPMSMPMSVSPAGRAG